MWRSRLSAEAPAQEGPPGCGGPNAGRGNPETPFAFGGMRWDPVLEMYYARNRWYAPDLGRFISPDPIGAWGDLLARLRCDFVVAESGAVVSPPPGWSVLRDKKYGRTRVTFLERAERDTPGQAH